jgi:predicted ribosome quality control (RQC) complex YloA/Tae2 family protein
MVNVELDPAKTVDGNAAEYYEKSKKLKRKMEGILTAVAETEKLIAKEELSESEKIISKKFSREKEWFESYHWLNIDGHLCIGGRDVKTNEILVKKHMDSKDLFFHSDVHGASVVIAKNGQELNDEALEKIALFSGCFSSAWKAGRGTVDVYCVKPEQVKTAAKSGEYLAKGSFVIAGERKYFKNLELQLGMTYEDDKLKIMPLELIKGRKIMLKPDAKKSKGETSKLAFKKLKELFPEGNFDVNWVQELLPNGGSRVY